MLIVSFVGVIFVVCVVVKAITFGAILSIERSAAITFKCNGALVCHLL